MPWPALQEGWHLRQAPDGRHHFHKKHSILSITDRMNTAHRHTKRREWCATPAQRGGRGAPPQRRAVARSSFYKDVNIFATTVYLLQKLYLNDP